MSIRAGELAKLIGARVVGDENVTLEGVAKIEEAASDEVTFVANPAYRKHIADTSAAAVIVDSEPEEGNATWLVTDDPYGAFLKALRHFHPEAPRPEPGIHPSAVVAETAEVADDATVGPQCVVEDGAVIGSGTILRAQVFVGHGALIGRDCLLHSRVTVRERCVLGDRVIIQDGAVIGSDGFGFAPGEEGYTKIPQVGNVVLEDDVEIGANATIDRATLGRTVVRRGAKLDNLIQIAHNVEVGSSTVMAAQVGVAGSTKIGARSMFGGQVGISGHIRLSDGVKVAAQSGIHKDPGEDKIVGGYPARDIREWQRIEAANSRLPDLLRRVRELEKKLGDKD